MALRMSTALCNKLHDTAATKNIFNLCFIKIYKGTPPANADALANVSDLLVTVSNNSVGATGLTWGPTAAGGVLSKTAAEVWSGLIGGTGTSTATWFRVVAAGDNGGADTAFTQPRVQGLIGTGGAVDMVVGSPGLASGATFTINYASLSFVPQ